MSIDYFGKVLHIKMTKCALIQDIIYICIYTVYICLVHIHVYVYIYIHKVGQSTVNTNQTACIVETHFNKFCMATSVVCIKTCINFSLCVR